MTIHRNHPGGSPDAGFTDKNFKSPILHKQNERLKNMTKPLNKGKKSLTQYIISIKKRN